MYVSLSSPNTFGAGADEGSLPADRQGSINDIVNRCFGSLSMTIERFLFDNAQWVLKYT